MNDMKRGTYVGRLASLRGKTALLQPLMGEAGAWLAKFDDRDAAHPETGDLLGYRWHLFARSDFALEDDDDDSHD